MTAIEPADNLRQLAKEYTGSDVIWLNDSLPTLSKITNNTFDLILVSAVWMHLDNIQRDESISRLRQLLSKHGLIVITLRQGNFEDGRTSQPLSIMAEQSRLIKAGFTPVLIKKSNDNLNRNSVKWHTLVFRFHEQ